MDEGRVRDGGGRGILEGWHTQGGGEGSAREHW